MNLSEISKESVEILEQWAAKNQDNRSFSIEKPLYQNDIRVWVYDANLTVGTYGILNIDALAVKSVEELEDLLNKKAHEELEKKIKHLQQFAEEKE